MSKQIKLIRIYDAPVKTVWDAWMTPSSVAQWWGPRGFTLTHHNRDLRVGGSWEYTMHGPDGTDYPNATKYFEVEPYARLVYDHGGYKDRPPLFRVTAVFIPLPNDKTQLELSMGFATDEEAEASRQFIKKAGGDATWDRLAEFLQKQ